MDNNELKTILCETIRQYAKKNDMRTFAGGDIEKIVREQVVEFSNKIQAIVEFCCNEEKKLYKSANFQNHVEQEYRNDWIAILKDIEKLEHKIVSSIN